jgi:hypothetical protein
MGFNDANTLTIVPMNNNIYTLISSPQSLNELGESIWSIILAPVFVEGPYEIHVP